MPPTIPLPTMPAAETLADMLPYYTQIEPVLDALPDLVFFVKDREARYVLVNRTLATRCGSKDKRAIVGKTTEEVFPSRFGAAYLEQDQSILNGGAQMIDQLELHLYPGRQPGWCLTSKVPLRNSAGGNRRHRRRVARFKGERAHAPRLYQARRSCAVHPGKLCAAAQSDASRANGRHVGRTIGKIFSQSLSFDSEAGAA
jgi:hypothetical protein